MQQRLSRPGQSPGPDRRSAGSGGTIPAAAGNTKRQIKFITDFGTTCLHIIPSYATRLAEVFYELGMDPQKDTKLKTICIGAEPHSEEQRQRIEQLLGVKAYNCFGMSEMNGPGVAFECTEQNGLHIWEDYVREIENVAQSGLYDILGHPFNLRLFNNFPEKNVDNLLEKTAEALKENNMAIDINTGTYYRYPINEISPYEDFMKLVIKYDLPVILSSDAHEPGHAGFMIKEAAEYALSFGIDKFLRFDKKKRISEMICLKNK